MAAGGVCTRLSARLDSVRIDPYQTSGNPGPALDRLRQYRRHQCAAHRAQGPRRGDTDLRHAEGHGRGGHRRLFRRPQRGDAGRARRLPRPPVPGMAEIQGRQRRRRLYRCPDRIVLAGCYRVLRGVGGDRGDLALLVAFGAGGEFRHADFPVVVRPFRTGLVVRRTDAIVVLRAPRQHRAIAGRDRRTDRGEVGGFHASFGAREARTSDAQLRIGESRANNFSIPGPREGACPGMTGFLYARASASSTNRAAASAPASSPNRPITCTPTGNPPSATIAGMLTQGTPISVHSRLKRGSPVQSNPFGAAPGAENVSKTSTLSKVSANAPLARLAIPRASSYSAGNMPMVSSSLARSSGGMAW